MDNLDEQVTVQGSSNFPSMESGVTEVYHDHVAAQMLNGFSDFSSSDLR